jgi:uncharacterized iron-regulated protein
MRTLTAALVLGTATMLNAQSSYVPERVYDSRRGEFSDFEAMLAELAKADVVFVGEQHDDPNTHRLELAVLEGLARRGHAVILSLEMFEKDVQETLDHFVMGHLEEEDFLKTTRPWPRYATDYKPLVDFAIEKSWPVVAANVPRPIASEVARGGLEVLQAKSPDERRLFAADLRCPLKDDYFRRFAEAMGEHPGGDDAAKQRTTERYYYSQCVKDETMAESIAQAVAAAPMGARRIVVHVNGAFHSDFGQGTAERTRRRMPGKRVAILSMLPVADLDAVDPSRNERKRADYLVYTYRPAASK